MNPLFKLTYGLHIVSTATASKKNGCLINTAIQVTAEPQQLSITLSKENLTTKLIQEKKSFTVCPLLENASMNLIAAFGFQSGNDCDKFSSVSFLEDSKKNPYPTEAIAARFSCNVTKEIDLASHIMFIGVITEAETLNETDRVLTYDYYQTVKKGTTPKNAPSYKKENPSSNGWKCKVCGYITEILPEDFVCPICKKTADFFEKI